MLDFLPPVIAEIIIQTIISILITMLFVLPVYLLRAVIDHYFPRLRQKFINDLRAILGIKEPSPRRTTPGERIQTLIKNLGQTSEEIDSTLQEIVADLKNRELALVELHRRNNELALQEQELKRKIDALKDVPVEVAEYFQRINQQNLEKIDRRSGRRDLVFFTLGILASALVSILLRFSGIG